MLRGVGAGARRIPRRRPSASMPAGWAGRRQNPTSHPCGPTSGNSSCGGPALPATPVAGSRASPRSVRGRGCPGSVARLRGSSGESTLASARRRCSQRSRCSGVSVSGSLPSVSPMIAAWVELISPVADSVSTFDPALTTRPVRVTDAPALVSPPTAEPSIALALVYPCCLATPPDSDRRAAAAAWMSSRERTTIRSLASLAASSGWSSDHSFGSIRSSSSPSDPTSTASGCNGVRVCRSTAMTPSSRDSADSNNSSNELNCRDAKGFVDFAPSVPWHVSARVGPAGPQRRTARPASRRPLSGGGQRARSGAAPVRRRPG